MSKNRKKIVGTLVALVLVTSALVSWRLWLAAQSTVAEPGAGPATDSADLAAWLGGLISQARPDDGPETLTGTVVDSTGKTIAEIMVSARKEGPQPSPLPRFALTDADGRFLVPGMARGLYRVRVAGLDILESEIRRVVVPGEALTLVVSRRVSVVGRVLDDKKPVAGAVVEIGGEGLAVAQSTESDADGRFAFVDLPEGGYVVSAHKEARAALLAVERFGQGPFADLEVSLGQAAVLAGAITDIADQTPIVGATLVLRPNQGRGGSRRAHTDEKGLFSLEGLAIGDWSLHVSAPEFLSPGPQLISMNKSGQFRADVELQRGAVVSGRVLSPTSDPVRGALVSLDGKDAAGKRVQVSATTRLGELARSTGAVITTGGDARARLLDIGELGVLPGPLPFIPPEGAIAAQALGEGLAGDDPFLLARSSFETGTDGRFRIAGVPAGRFVAHAKLAGTAGGQSAPLLLRAGSRSESVIIKLRQGIKVWGVVRDENGLGILAAEVTARRDGEIIEIAFSDDEGRYQLERALGHIDLRARAPGYAAKERRVHLAQADDGGEREQSFVLGGANQTIEGRVIDVNRQPVASAQVFAVGLGGPGKGHKRSARADDDGGFMLGGLAKGSYMVHATHAAFLPSVSASIESGKSAVELTVRFAGGVAGTISDAHSRAPIAGAVIVAEGPDGAKVSKTLTTADFSLTPLAPGKWRLGVSLAGYAPAALEVDVPAGRGPSAVTVRDVQAQLVRGATVGGTVVDSHGEIVSGATVKSGAARATTDRDGRFLLRAVTPGDVLVSASHPQAGNGQTQVPLRSGDEVLSLQISLQIE